MEYICDVWDETFKCLECPFTWNIIDNFDDLREKSPPRGDENLIPILKLFRIIANVFIDLTGDFEEKSLLLTVESLSEILEDVKKYVF